MTQLLVPAYAEMGKLILEHEGTLERFTGDGMMIPQAHTDFQPARAEVNVSSI